VSAGARDTLAEALADGTADRHPEVAVPLMSSLASSAASRL
jgi:hypothetical protein